MLKQLFRPRDVTKGTETSPKWQPPQSDVHSALPQHFLDPLPSQRLLHWMKYGFNQETLQFKTSSTQSQGLSSSVLLNPYISQSRNHIR